MGPMLLSVAEQKTCVCDWYLRFSRLQKCNSRVSYALVQTPNDTEKCNSRAGYALVLALVISATAVMTLKFAIICRFCSLDAGLEYPCARQLERCNL